MKVHWFDRVLLFLIACFLLACTALFVALLVGPVSTNVSARIGNLPIDTQGRMLLIGGAVILLVFSVYLLVTALQRRRKPAPRGVLVRTGEFGAVEITLSALDTMVQKCVRGISGVRDCVNLMNVTPSGSLDLQLRLSLLPDTDVPELTKQVQGEVKSYVEAHAGVDVNRVAVLVESAGPVAGARVQ